MATYQPVFSLESEWEGSAHIEVVRQGHGLDGSEFEWGVACAQMYLLWFYTEEELGVETALDNLSLTDFNGDADPVSNGGGGGGGGVTPTSGGIETPSSSGGIETTPFVLSEASPVIPKKIVNRILKGEFVDMAELLKDNMEADRRKRTAEGIAPKPAFGSVASCRDVPDVMSWAQCFSHHHPEVSQ